MTFLIGLMGYKQSGKSEVAKHLMSMYKFERLAFTDPLKDMIKGLGLSNVWVNGSLKEKENKDILNGHTPRYAMQTLGTEWARKYMGEDFWVNLWKTRAKAILRTSKDSRLVVEDLRFPNEAEIIRKFGGEIWYVNRVDIDSEKEIDTHASETMISTIKFNRIIINNSDLPALYENTDAAFLYMKEDLKK